MENTKIEPGTRINIPVGLVEFNVEGNTIWIHSPLGGTTMRIKCSGKIKIDQCATNLISHCDIMVNGDINFCLSEDATD